MKPVVLVTAIGTAASTTISAELRKTNDYHIIGADIYKDYMVASSKDVDEFYVFPSAIDDLDSYIEFALDFCSKHHVQYYFPTIDEEVVNLSNNRSRFEAIGVKLCIPNPKLIEICHYKNVFNTWIRDNFPDLSITTYSALSDISRESYPLFLKPIEGRASNGCKKISNQAELVEMMEKLDVFRTNVVQQYVTGDIVAVDLVRSSVTNQMLMLQRREILRNGNGCGIAVEIISDKKLVQICEDLMVALDLNGVVNAEFFASLDGYKIIEINPRFSAGTSFSCLAGVNTVINALNIVDQRGLNYDSVLIGRHFAKRYETYQTD